MSKTKFRIFFVLLFGILSVLNVTDYIMTKSIISLGGYEANSVLNYLIGIYGVQVILYVKLFWISIISLGFVIEKRWILIALALIDIVYGGLFWYSTHIFLLQHSSYVQGVASTGVSI